MDDSKVTQPDLPKQEKEYVPEHKLWGTTLKAIQFGFGEAVKPGEEFKVLSADSRHNTAVVILPSGISAVVMLDDIQLHFKHGHEARDTGT